MRMRGWPPPIVLFLSFSCFPNRNHSDVVILGKRAGKVAYILDNSFYNRLGAVGRAGANRLDHAIKPEFISVGIERFRDAVGIKNQAIIALERDSEIGGKPIEHISAVNSYDHSGRLYGCNCLRVPFVE